MPKERLDKSLKAYFLNHDLQYSRAAIQHIISAELVMVNNHIVTDKNFRISNSDKIEVDLNKARELYENKIRIVCHDTADNNDHHQNKNNINTPNIDVQYENKDFIIINKNAGIVVHAGVGNHHDTLVHHLIKQYSLNNLSSIDKNIRPGIVHRLDKDTSGLMIIAKNNRAHTILSQQIADREIHRTYIAFVHGLIAQPSGTIRTHIAKSRQDCTKMIAVNPHNMSSNRSATAKHAVTHYHTIKRFIFDKDKGIGITVVRCKLETGRTHQIRLHMRYIGHPIIGDTKYGYGYNFNYNSIDDTELVSSINEFSRQALHSSTLSFSNMCGGDTIGETISVNCDMPHDMRTLFDVLEKYEQNH